MVVKEHIGERWPICSPSLAISLLLAVCTYLQRNMFIEDLGGSLCLHPAAETVDWHCYLDSNFQMQHDTARH